MSILAALGWDLPAEELRTMARRNEETPESFVKGLALAIRESFLERQVALPFAMGAIRSALRERMEEK